jgi:hypothetical protein
MADLTVPDEATDLRALRSVVVDAAAVSSGLWFSYIFLLLYLTIAVAGVSHTNLLFEDSAKLPFLNVDLPLVSFFVVGPLLFLVVHAYLLIHYVLFAGKVGTFGSELAAQVSDEVVRGNIQQQLPSNIFVQVIAGPDEIRTGVVGWMLRLFSRISLVIGPLVLLIFFSGSVFPASPIAFWQRAAVGIDLLLLWILWPSIEAGKIRWISATHFPSQSGVF